MSPNSFPSNDMSVVPGIKNSPVDNKEDVWGFGCLKSAAAPSLHLTMKQVVCNHRQNYGSLQTASCGLNLASYHRKNQSFLEKARKEKGERSVAERGLRRLTMAKGLQDEPDHVKSKQSLHSLDDRSFLRLHHPPQTQPMAHAIAAVPARKHQWHFFTEPKTIATSDDDHWSQDLEILSMSTNGIFPGKGGCSVSSGLLSCSSGHARDAGSLDSSKTEADLENDHNHGTSVRNSAGMDRKIEAMKIEFCTNDPDLPPEEGSEWEHIASSHDIRGNMRYMKWFEDDLERVHLFNSEASEPYGLFSRWQKILNPYIHSAMTFVAFAEVFLANMPTTIVAVGLSWATQGTVWFKFMQENIDACPTVRYNSDLCPFGEFRGCFECDTSNSIYKLALYFHYGCHSIAFTCCSFFLLKIIIAARVVVDELRNPATSSPMGIACITLECIFAGLYGKIGECIVLGVSIFHVLLSFWFCYIAIFKFRLLPDPSWYPNCIGLAYAAVKTWLYFPWLGKGFMVLCIFYFFSLFFIGSIRVVTNLKIAAPVCFISLSAPSITMYAMTIMAQPSRHREEMIEADPALMQQFQRIYNTLYIPVLHCMMGFSLLGMASALHSLYQRWPTCKSTPFSPAHFAYIFPIMLHTNAVQAYRSGVDNFALIPIGTPFKQCLFTYWFICLISGTILNCIFTAKYVKRLPKWTQIDVFDELEQPSSPSHTFVHKVMNYESDVAHEFVLSQHFMSPAVLQANEAGQLVRLRRGTYECDKYGSYVRTCNVASFGFDSPMTNAELRQEGAELFHWVGMNGPRTMPTPSQDGMNQSESVLPGLMVDGDHNMHYAALEVNNESDKDQPRSTIITCNLPLTSFEDLDADR